MIAIALLLLLALAPSGDPSPPHHDGSSLEWRLLLLIKPRTDVQLSGLPPVNGGMDARDVETLKKVFTESTPAWIEEATRGRVRWSTEVLVSSLPLTRVSGRSASACWVTPDDVMEDLSDRVPTGSYDGVFVCWKTADGGTGRVLPAVSWSEEPAAATSQSAFTSLPYTYPMSWTPESDAFLRGWVQQLQAYYRKRGVTLPADPPPTTASDGADPRHWYELFLNGEIEGPGGTHVGLGEKAWMLGTIRGEGSRHSPDYVRGKLNLLRNASFEGGDQEWQVRSRASKRKAVSVGPGSARSGSRCAKLAPKDPDDLSLVQKVKVKPRTRYLYSSWIKTENVVIAQGGSGATIGIAGGTDRSAMLTGSHDWTYVCFEFESGERKEVEADLRLGLSDSPASGIVWFDDASLVEIVAPAGSTPEKGKQQDGS